MIRKAPSPVPFEGGLACRPEDRAAPAALIEPVGRGDREQSGGGECDCHEGIPQESATLGNEDQIYMVGRMTRFRHRSNANERTYDNSNNYDADARRDDRLYVRTHLRARISVGFRPRLYDH